MNLVFLGTLPYPQGMAATKRIQYTINGMKCFPDVSIRVVVLRQSSKENAPNGIHDGIPYETVMTDLQRIKLVLLAPIFCIRTKCAIQRIYRADMDNILYVYGHTSFDNLPAILFARRLGYKIVFDIVEDEELADNLSKRQWGKVKKTIFCRISRLSVTLADGIIVVSSHLEKKFSKAISGAIPIHFHPITMDIDKFSGLPQSFGDPVKLFYGGCFGSPKGADKLIKAFDILIGKGLNVRLVLTGPDGEKLLPKLLSVCENEASRKSIEYHGYLDDEEYYHALSQADIPCIPRTDHVYAHGGFPFRLGEYLATGKPVVVSDVSDISRFLENRSDAVIVKPGSVDSLVDGISYLLSHPDEASSIGARGRLAARKFFDYKIQAERLYSFFCGLINGK